MAEPDVFGVMTSGASTAALLALRPALGQLVGCPVVLLSRSVGVGETHIPNRLRRGEVADIVIVADDLLRQCMAEGLVIAGSRVPLVYSEVGMAVRAGSARPDIATMEALKRVLLDAASIAYSASVSGQYLATELWPRMGVAEAVLPKSRCIGDERIGAVVARGEADIGFEQVSELLPVPGIAHVIPLPPEAQKTTLFSGGVAASSPEPARARAVLEFLRSSRAHRIIIDSGLRPATN
ncbi:MAG: substrate-binding domain-containing protein [Burkholderiales bacterium]